MIWADDQTTIKRKLQDFSQNFDALTELDNQAEVSPDPSQRTNSSPLDV